MIYMPVEQDLLTLQEHMSSPPVFSGVRVARSLSLCSFLPLYCLSSFDLRHPELLAPFPKCVEFLLRFTVPLVSSNFSYLVFFML
jgi:hypothetical protein